jgi:hypothetical protein
MKGCKGSVCLDGSISQKTLAKAPGLPTAMLTTSPVLVA